MCSNSLQHSVKPMLAELRGLLGSFSGALKYFNKLNSIHIYLCANSITQGSIAKLAPLNGSN
jgi:hypothetical protein